MIIFLYASFSPYIFGKLESFWEVEEFLRMLKIFFDLYGRVCCLISCPQRYLS